ncbi:histone H3.v1 [Ricinus communis]|uniref:DNA binding protein, putative n=1 Tax=Ricinus communis TaxID=3988 RepID=B9REI7_RICCO|nr:histone H3.v1 [Ricinus communis]EEF50190.1 DNA binding protein, putative [Ricinus communis]|eukprot:XP_002512156.1 histone H3.v1 [Ricinus communis]
MEKEKQATRTETQNREEEAEERWGTWEELLLACAVKRHGFKNWDSVSMELQTRTSLPHFLTSARNCQQKYHDLHRRFTTSKNDFVQPQEEEDENNSNKVASIHIPWLEELRKLRVAELKQEVHRYDISIHSLQLKVKRLEEEREKGNQNDDVTIPDLEQPQSDKKEEEEEEEEESEQKESVSGDESDRENRSVNESNSTGSEGEKKGVAKPSVQEDEEAPVLSGSSSKSVESHELADSVTQLSSEVQSSASLGGKRKRKGRKRREEIAAGGDGIKGRMMVKSEPLIALLESIRAHNHASLFEGPLKTQETDVYKNMIRQHLDLETIQTKLEQGSYSSSNLLCYRDLLLLFNNAIVFFSKSSNESTAAYELRSVVSNQMKKEIQKPEFTAVPQEIPPQPKSELQKSDSLLAKHKASAPIVVCRKRSSLTAKPSPSSFGQKTEQQQPQQQQQQINDNEPPSDSKPPVVEQSLLKIEAKEKPVTGTRSSRRSNKNLAKGTTTPSKKQNASPTTKVDTVDRPETPKTEKKKTEVLALDKKRSAADFLKRIKKNSPVETAKKNTRGSVNGGMEWKKDNNTGKGEKGKERVLRKNGDEKQVEESSPSKRNVGRPSKKSVEVSKVSGKRGRENVGKEAAKRPKKRSRR